MRTVVAAAPALVALALALSPSDARADVPPPNSSGCTTKKAGEACTRDDGAQGTCATSTCSRINYDCDGGKSPCGSVSYDCVLCGPAGGSGDGGAADAGESTATPSCSVSSGGGAPGMVAATMAVLAALVLARRPSRRR